jgi:hypothetical protein
MFVAIAMLVSSLMAAACSMRKRRCCDNPVQRQAADFAEAVLELANH